MNKRNILALAEHMRSLPGDRFDQTRAVHDDGSPSCLLAHMMNLFGDGGNPNDPMVAKDAAVRILGTEKGQADFLYAGSPLGVLAHGPTPPEAAFMLTRLATVEDAGVRWPRDPRSAQTLARTATGTDIET